VVDKSQYARIGIANADPPVLVSICSKCIYGLVLATTSAPESGKRIN